MCVSILKCIVSIKKIIQLSWLEIPTKYRIARLTGAHRCDLVISRHSKGNDRIEFWDVHLQQENASTCDNANPTIKTHNPPGVGDEYGKDSAIIV